MSLDGDTSGPPVVLRPHGLVRLLPAAFLAFWLCGWAVGEAFAIAAVVGALHALFGTPVPAWMPVMKVGANGVLPILLFLGVWLTFWTLGGAAAMTALAGLLWGSEEVAWDSEHVEITHRAFPFTHRTRHAWADVLRIESARAGGVAAITRRGRKPLVTCGTPEEREALFDRLRSAWHATRPRGAGESLVQSAQASGIPDELPIGWKSEPDEMGQLAAMEPPGAKALVAILLVVFVVAAGAAIAQTAGAANAEGWTGGRVARLVFLAVLEALMLFGAVMLGCTRQSVHPRPGAILRRERRFGHACETLWMPARLELQTSTDSDGDPWWKLVVTGGAEKPATLVSAVNDPEPALRLGRWLSSRSGVPFVDAAPDSRRPAA